MPSHFVKVNPDLEGDQLESSILDFDWFLHIDNIDIEKNKTFDCSLKKDHYSLQGRRKVSKSGEGVGVGGL